MDSTDAPPPRTRLPDWTPRHRFDVAAYHRMGETGILGRKPRVELIEGEIVELSPAGSRHINTVIRLTMLFANAVGERGRVSPQNPVRLNDHSEPEPDIALLRPVDPAAPAATPRPADVVLLIEVAASSLRYDRQFKLPLYARHGIAEVWIADIDRRTIELHRAPDGYGYLEVRVAHDGDMIAAASLADRSFGVSEILPPR